MLKESTISILEEKKDYYEEMYTMCVEALNKRSLWLKFVKIVDIVH